MSRKDEFDQFTKITDSILREDPTFDQRTKRIEVRSRGLFGKLLALFSLSIGLIGMLISVSYNQPLLGVIFFLVALTGLIALLRKFTISSYTLRRFK